MKKITLLISCLLITGFLQALTVVSTAGGLADAIKKAGGNLDSISSLTVEGKIDARDFQTMKMNMPVLSSIDLSKATIVEYTGTEGTGTKKSVTYPANEVPSFAFYLETNLTNVVVPTSANKIGYGAFGECTGLTSINMPATITNFLPYSFYGCTALTSMEMPTSLKAIAINTFTNCTGLTSITIPSGVTFIGNEAFSGCTGLKSIYAKAATPISITNATNVFNNINKNTCTLYVPVGSKSLYKAEYQWKDFILVVEK